MPSNESLFSNIQISMDIHKNFSFYKNLCMSFKFLESPPIPAPPKENNWSFEYVILKG